MSKLISFEHNGIQYLNFDMSNEQSVAYLIAQIGQESYDDIIKNLANVPTAEERIAMLENMILLMMEG